LPNTAPVAQAQSVTTAEDTAKEITLTATDAENNPLTYAIVATPTHGTLGSISSNRVTYTPAANYNGPDSFTFRASDGSLTSSNATVSITVTPVNDAPVAQPQGVSTAQDMAKEITLVAIDPENDPLTYAVATGPLHGSLSVVSSNSVTYTPALNYSGPDSFTFQASDASLTSMPATVSINVSFVNTPPVAQTQSVTTAEETAKVITLVATDVETNALTYAVVTGPTYGTLSVISSNRVTYTPATNYNGLDSFTFKANDGQADSAPATVSITVTPVNDAPVAQVQSVTTPEDTATEIALVATDVDNNPLTYTIVTNPTHGTLSAISSNVVTYTPAPNYNGPDSFTFKGNDGLLNSTPATVSITVTPVNDAPVAQPQSVVTAEDTAKVITLVATDVETNALAYAVVSEPSHGTLSISSPNSVTYTPSTNYTGPDSFTFKASDGLLDSSPATVSLTVTPNAFFASDAVTTDERSGSVELRVVGGTATRVTSVAYWLVPGTATMGLDYTPPTTMPRRIVWTNMAGEQTITIPIKTDALIEDDETFYVLLGSPTNCVIGEPSVCKVTITDSNSGLTLADALDNTVLTWTTGGTPPWVPQTTVTHDGEDAAVSGAMASNKVSFVQTSVTGTGTVSFAWSVAGMGTLRLLDGTKVLAAVTNDTSWETRPLVLTQSAAHALKWEFTQGSSTNGRAYLDQVVWLPGNKMDVAVTAAASNPLGGLATGTGVYYAGAKVPLNAKPRPGWLFTGWTPTNYFAKPLTAVQTLTISNSAINVTANFVKVPVLMGLPNPPEGGTVSGSGLCLPGKSVTLKATPAAKWAFTSWSDGSMLASRVVSATGDVTLYAGFKPIPQIAVPVITNPGAQNAMVGVPFGLALQVASECLPTVTVIGLPAGLTFDAGSRTISGVPTAVPVGGGVKATISASNPAGKAVDAPLTITVEPLAGEAQGTFTGVAVGAGAGSEMVKGIFTMTVTPVGAISAKVTGQETAISFTGKSWDRARKGVFQALLRTVKGEELTLELDTGGAWNSPNLLGTLSGGFFGASSLTVLGQRNAFLVKTAPDYETATNVLANYKGYYTVALSATNVLEVGAAGNVPQGSGYLALTVKDGGGVTLAGKLSDGTPLIGSSTLFVLPNGVAGVSVYVPLFFPLYTARGVFTGLMALGLPAGTAPANNVAVAVGTVVQAWRYPGKAPTAIPPQTEDRFTLTLGMSGGYNNSLQDLRAHYSNGWFSAQVPGVTNTFTSGSYTTKVGVVQGELPDVQLAFNPSTGVVSLPLGKAPVYTAGTYVYAPTNPAMATLSVTKATGLFTGKFNLYYEYPDQLGARKLTTVLVTHEGVLTPERLDAAMPSGQGFYLVPDTWKSTGVPAAAYLLNRSYGVEIQDGQ
jgi:VCBS repeat-containing protein